MPNEAKTARLLPIGCQKRPTGERTRLNIMQYQSIGNILPTDAGLFGPASMRPGGGNHPGLDRGPVRHRSQDPRRRVVIQKTVSADPRGKITFGRASRIPLTCLPPEYPDCLK